MAQTGFFDRSDRYASLNAKKDPLIEINAVVPWDEFLPLLERIWRRPDAAKKSRAGRKPMDVVMMFKALVLSALYTLSDDQLEYQVRDRLSFMRFLGLGLGDRVPDAKTVWLYREVLAKAGMVDELFAQFDGYLARRVISLGVARSLTRPSCRCRTTTTNARKTWQSKRARCPRIGKASLRNAHRKTLTPVGPRSMARRITATRTTSMWTENTS